MEQWVLRSGVDSIQEEERVRIREEAAGIRSAERLRQRLIWKEV